MGSYFPELVLTPWASRHRVFLRIETGQLAALFAPMSVKQVCRWACACLHLGARMRRLGRLDSAMA